MKAITGQSEKNCDAVQIDRLIISRVSSMFIAGSRTHAGQGHAVQGHAGLGHAGLGHAAQAHAVQGLTFDHTHDLTKRRGVELTPFATGTQTDD